VYNGGSCRYFENVQHLSSSSLNLIFISFCSVLTFILHVCVLGPKMCICTDNVATQEVFQIPFPQFERQNKKHFIHNWWKVHIIQYHVCIIHSVFLCNSIFPNVTFLFMLQFIIFVGTVFEVLKLLTIYNAVWVRTLYSLAHVYECSGGSFWVYIHR
jgi:hypothetical protein